MRAIDENLFLGWAKSHGYALTRFGSGSQYLEFDPKSDERRFWEISAEPERRGFMFLALLELMGDWKSCYAWRHQGSWPAAQNHDRLNDSMEFIILSGMGMPSGTTQAVEFSREEQYNLVTLMLSTSIFGWSVGEDMSIVPDHGRYLMQTDHHDVIHTCFRSSEDRDAYVQAMAKRGYALPSELPDTTFKLPGWFK